MGPIDGGNQTSILRDFKAQIGYFDELLNFLYDLRKHRFRVSPPQFIAAQKLLVALAAEGRLEKDLRNLKTYLSPLFSFSREEQQRFYLHYERWLKDHAPPEAFNPLIPPPPLPPLPNPPVPPSPPPPAKTKWWQHNGVKAAAALTGAFLMTVLVVTLVNFYSVKDYSLSGEVRDSVSQQPISGADIKFSNQAGRSDPSGSFSFNYQSKSGQQIPLSVSHQNYETFDTTIAAGADQEPLPILLNPLSTPPRPDLTTPPVATASAAPDPTEKYELIYQWLLVLAVMLPFALFLFWLLWRFWWRKFLERWRDRHKPDLRRIRVENAENRLYRKPEFLRVARELRRHRRIVSNALEPTATIEATIRAGNFFTPVYGVRHLSPEYLILIDRLSYADQNARLADEIVSRLKSLGIFVDRFFFKGDPRACWREGKDNKFYDLTDLAARFPDHRLLIFSDGEGLIDPFSNRPQEWLAGLFAWDIRTLLTTNAAQGFVEWILNYFGLPVIPAREKELKQLLEIINAGELPRKKSPARDGDEKANFPPSLREDFDIRWLDKNEPEDDEAGKKSGASEKAEMLRVELRYYLGAEGYELLCASAIYPEMLWDLTFYLAHRLIPAERRESALEAVVCLPWFRHGTMPDWLRGLLLESLPPEREALIRRELEQLLISYLENPKRGFRLEIARQNLSANLLSRLKNRLSAWFRKKLFHELIKTEPENSPLRDIVFLSFFSRGRLSVAIPRALNRSILYGKHLAKTWPKRIFDFAARAVVAIFNFLRGFYHKGIPLLGLSSLKAFSIPVLATVLGILMLMLPLSGHLVTGFPDDLAKNLPRIDLGIPLPFGIPAPSASPTPSNSPAPFSPTPITPSPTVDTSLPATITPLSTPPVTPGISPSITPRVSPSRTPIQTPSVSTPATVTPTPIPSVSVITPPPTPVPSVNIPTPTPSGCPKLNMQAPSDVSINEPATFTASVIGGSQSSVTYDWVISGGVITSGQGTLAITVDFSGVRPGNYTITLDIGGIAEECQSTTTRGVAVRGNEGKKPVATALYTFVKITSTAPLANEKLDSNLDNYFSELNNDPTATGYIILYGDDRSASMAQRVIQQRVNSTRFDASRLVFVRGGTSQGGGKLWIVPAGAEQPTP